MQYSDIFFHVVMHAELTTDFLDYLNTVYGTDPNLKCGMKPCIYKLNLTKT